jgi:hypothetical protein
VADAGAEEVDPAVAGFDVVVTAVSLVGVFVVGADCRADSRLA